MKKIYTLLLLIVIPFSLISCKNEAEKIEKKIVTYNNEVSENEFYTSLTNSISNHRNSHLNQDYEITTNTSEKDYESNTNGKIVKEENNEILRENISKYDFDNKLIEGESKYNNIRSNTDSTDNYIYESKQKIETLIENVDGTYYNLNKTLKLAILDEDGESLFESYYHYDKIYNYFSEENLKGYKLYKDNDVYTAVILDDYNEDDYLKKIYKVIFEDEKLSLICYKKAYFKDKNEDHEIIMESIDAESVEVVYKEHNLKTIDNSDYKIVK